MKLTADARRQLVIDEGQVRTMQALGVFRIADSLNRKQTDFERDLLNAVHWFSESQLQAKPEHELVNLITAAETVVAREPGKTHGVTDKMCEAVAVVLTTDIKGRQELFDFMESTCE